MADVLPVDRFCELLDLVPEDAIVAIAAEEELAPALRDYWEDVTTSFHDDDAHHLYVKPEALDAALDERPAAAVEHLPGPAARVRAQAGHRGALACATPSPSSRSWCAPATAPSWRGRGAARPSAPSSTCARMQPAFLDGKPAPEDASLTFAHARPARRLHRAQPEARGPAGAPPARRRAERRASPGRSRRSPTSRGSRWCTRTGIALFTGFETKTVGGRRPDYLELEYRDGDRVFVPSDQLHKISRYVGADAGDPPLSKLGGKQWEQMKLKARRAAQALAGELINRLRAQAPRRPRFPMDSEWQLEFEARFPYRETPDQLEAIEAVRADMEEAPMDRLICGDVGYGKTEVALRAAFKAAEDGKQVMFLVPTTVLAQQHYGTFVELRDYPFTIEMVSRFRSRRRCASRSRASRRAGWTS